MSNVLMVPVYLDALYLPYDRSVVEAMANFSRLPYFNGERDVNPDVANLSEEILSRPFQDRSLYLKAGIHLHWALPDALTRGVHDFSQGVTFPAVPNRWLVSRTYGPHTKQWVVESDYLYPRGSSDRQNGISYPYPDDPKQPFRYMGRKLALAAWKNKDKVPQNGSQYLDKLTAVGYGEPTFAAFYPNCHSVFGFHDDDYDTDHPPPEELRYIVIGWYSNIALNQDPFRDFTNDFKNRMIESNQTPTLEILQAAVKDEFKWKVVVAPGQEFPQQMVCYASLSIKQANFNFPSQGEPAEIAVGNTATEALSAYLADRLDGDKFIHEDQLEALHLSTRLAGRTLDTGPKFKEARHEKEFTAVPGGTIWTIRPESTTSAPANAGEAPSPTEASLPDGPAHHLNQLNLKQQAYDRANQELESLRQQLFADWYKYMLSAYPPPDSRNDYPNIDAVKYYIEAYGLKPLKQKTEATGTLVLQRTPSGQASRAAAWLYLFSLDVKLKTGPDPLILDDLRSPFSQANYPLSSDARLAKAETGEIWSLSSGDKQFVINQEAGRLKVYLVGAGTPAMLAAQLAQAINTMLAELPTLQEVTPADLRDWPKFQEKLLRGSRPLAIQRVWDLLSAEVQKMLGGKLTQPAQEEIISTFNGILWNKSFYDPAIFSEIELPDEAQSLLGQRATWSEAQVVRFNRLLLEAIFPQHLARRPNYVLKQVPAPRYWQPNDPMVLITGPAARPSPRYGADGLLECQTVSLAEETIADNLAADILSAVTTKIDGLKGGEDREAGHTPWKEQPWHPLLLEWQVEFFPTEEGHNLDPQNRAYDPKFITRSYQLAENEVDLSLKPGQEPIDKAANIYSGRAILTPHAHVQLKERLAAFLEKLQRDDFYQAGDIPAAQQGDYNKMFNTWYDRQKYPLKVEDWTALQTWYEDKPAYYNANITQVSDLPAEERSKDPIYTAIRAYGAVAPINVLAQALGGFNEALLMRKQTLQLPIADPLGFDDYQPFTATVAEAVQQSSRSAPQPLNDFNPIRAGVLKLLRLRLVDTFGQVMELKGDQVITTEVMTIPGQPHLISLPPRLAQPARLNFRWLAAEIEAGQSGDEPEMNSHPATTPVCGWLLPNHLDNSLMVFDNQGQALGSITEKGQWLHAPGSLPPAVSQRRNPHLNRLINQLIVAPQMTDPKLIEQRQSFLINFMIALESALENIHPEDAAHHDALALLIGQPIAVVRATLNLELQGRPALNQDWNVFRQDMGRRGKESDFQAIQHPVRENDDFTQVQFPIRLGEYRQLNDGLIGYWLEDENGYRDNKFYAPQAIEASFGEIEHPDIVVHQEGQPCNLNQSLADPPLKLTMLVDPRGVVHATCGLVPTKALRIPPDQFAQALRRLEVTFLSAPILTPADLVNLPLPQEPGYTWAWLEKENGVWADNYPIGMVDFKATFAGAQVIREGWLKLIQREET